MFREMRRFKQRISEEECIEILKAQPRGVLALTGDDGYPYALPLDYIYEEGKLYFHGAREGYKLDCIRKNNKASFCVLNEGVKNEGEWFLRFKSVIIFGQIRFIDDLEEALVHLRRLGLKYYPAAKFRCWNLLLTT